MKAYKGFNSGMKCRGSQYKEGETYEEKEASLCNSGFHACEDALDCLSYYNPADGAEYHEVELDDVSPERGDDSKVCGKRIRIGAKLKLGDLIDASVKFSLEKTKDADEIAKGNYSTAASSGNYSKAASSGNYSKASVKGKNTVAAAIGKDSKVKGDIGSWIIATEYGEFDETGFPCIGVVSAQIDGEELLPDVWYKAQGGKFVKAE